MCRNGAIPRSMSIFKENQDYFSLKGDISRYILNTEFAGLNKASVSCLNTYLGPYFTFNKQV